MADEIHLDAGDNAEDVIAGAKNQQSRQQANPRQRSDPQQNVTVQGMASENTLQGINWKLNEHGQQIFQLNFLMDDLPNKVQDLRVSDKDQDVRLDRLERAANTVITVKPGPPPVVEIVSKPIEPVKPVAEKISVHTMLWILLGVIGFGITAMGIIVWLVQRG